MSGMHDNPSIYPTLPPAFPDETYIEATVGPNRGTVWETCWEYVVTHKLSETEGAAFWNGANLVFEAMRERIVELDDSDETRDPGYWDAISQVLALLALPRADRPGYREEWRV